MDARGKPQRVILAHPMNEFTQLTTDAGPPRPSAGFPAPIGAKACSMPPQYRVRLNDPGRPEQAWQKPAHPYQQRPVASTQLQTMWCPPERDVELVTKKDILTSTCRRGLNRSAMKITSRWRMASIAYDIALIFLARIPADGIFRNDRMRF